MNHQLREFVRRWLDETGGAGNVVRCAVCGSLTALFQIDDLRRPICPRHGSEEAVDRFLMQADAHLLLDHFFQPDMHNPQ